MMTIRWQGITTFIVCVWCISADDIPSAAKVPDMSVLGIQPQVIQVRRAPISGHNDATTTPLPDKTKYTNTPVLAVQPHVIQVNTPSSGHNDITTTSLLDKGTYTNYSVLDSNSLGHDNVTTISLKDKMNRTISISGDTFMLDGKPLRFVSGSLHYFRVPAAYWRDRLRKLRSAGLQAVATYVEWSFHEPEERQYRFDGDYDLAQFVRMAAEEGLLVLLRPGPYICAERDLGGIPYWILGKYPQIKLRTTNKDFISESKIWLKKLFELMTPLLYGNGGPIILVQVENEYGSYGSDKAYMEASRDIMAEHVGAAALLYTTDGAWPLYFKPGSVSGALTTIDFGTDVKVAPVFLGLRNYMPHGPLMNSEFYPGWLTHWSERLSVVDANRTTATLQEMLKRGANVNFYVFFGGTNFGFTSGANYFNRYQPDITSYDYDAPLNEAGDPTPKYFAIRNVLETYFPETKQLPLPEVSKKGAYGKVNVKARVRLLSPAGRTALGKKYASTTGSSLPTFEQLRQFGGFLLYEINFTVKPSTSLNGSLETKLLEIMKPRDRVYVFIDGVLKGIISRMHKIYDLPLSLAENSNVTLSLLVENQGRINFGNKLHDFKGILGSVFLDKKALTGEWSVLGYPLDPINMLPEETFIESDSLVNGPTLYEGSFTIADNQTLDTFLDTTGWSKGYVWINGHNLGRYWPVEGPQVTLYVPGVWLNAAPHTNKFQILELEKAPSDLTAVFIDHPILDRVIKKKSKL